MPVAVADHHAVGLDDQHPGRWVMLLSQWLVPPPPLRPGAALLAFPLPAPPFGVCAQCLAADLYPGQLGQELGCFTEGGDGAQSCLPACQTSTCLLIGGHAKCLIRRAPTMSAAPAMVPPALQPNRTQTGLDAA